MPHDPRKLAQILTDGALGRLGAEAQRRRELTAAIRRQLATPEAEHLVSAATNGAGDLVLVVDSPAWAARIRYATTALPYPRVIVKVRPPGAS
jgi:hypothetical protein